MIAPGTVAEAAARLEGVVHATPIHHARLLDEACGCIVHLKAECFQRGGAFKFRGAYHCVSLLSDAERARGVITHSSGNHAQGLALAARAFGIPAVVVMPEDAPAAKRAATEAYGARIVPCRAEAREATCQAEIDAHGYTLVHPYDDPRIIAGQGTATLELLRAHPEIEWLLVPVGGGGLASGAALAAAHLGGRCKVIGVEPAVADDARRSLMAGRIVTLEQTRSIGTHPLEVLSAHLHDLVTVSEEAIRSALLFLWSRTKLLVEPSAAVPVAALLERAVTLPRGAKVGVILSGGNVDPATLHALTAPPA